MALAEACLMFSITKLKFSLVQSFSIIPTGGNRRDSELIPIGISQ